MPISEDEEHPGPTGKADNDGRREGGNMDTDRRDGYIEKELSMNLNSDNIGLARSIHHSQN